MFWEFDLGHSSLSSKFHGDVGFADVYCSEFSVQLSVFVDDWGNVFSLEVVDEVFIGIGGFFSNVFLGEEVGMGWGSGCFSLYNLICSVVIWSSVCVVLDIDCSFGPVYYRVDFL